MPSIRWHFGFMVIMHRVYFLIFIIVIYIGSYIFGYLGRYKSEKLICNVQEKRCEVERITNSNKVERQFVVDPHEVKDLIVTSESYRKRYRRHRHRTYTYYTVKFVKFDDKYRAIFARGFNTEEEAEAKADEIKAAFKSGNNIFEVSR